MFLGFLLIKNRKDVEGVQRHFSLYFVGNWISDCSTVFRRNDTVFSFFGSLEYPGENIPCKKVNYQISSSFWGLFWRTFGLWNKLSVKGDVHLGKRMVASRRHASRQSEQKLFITSPVRENMKETHSRMSFIFYPIALWSPHDCFIVLTSILFWDTVELQLAPCFAAWFTDEWGLGREETFWIFSQLWTRIETEMLFKVQKSSFYFWDQSHLLTNYSSDYSKGSRCLILYT